MCARTAAAASNSDDVGDGKKHSKNELDHTTMIESAMDVAKRVSAASASFRKPAAFFPSYGTAGFRAKASLLDSTLFR